MNLNKFTEKAQEAVLGAQQLAVEGNSPQVEPEHLLVALVEQSGGVVPSVLRKLNVEPQPLAKAFRDHLAKQPKAHGGAEPNDLASPASRLRRGAGRRQGHAGRVREHRASAAWDSERARQSGVARSVEAAPGHARQSARSAGGCSRQSARDRSESGEQVRGAGEVRPRSDRARAQGQARPGDRS